ncbi:hypothetical protein K2X33_09510, partial [bacterium]|nr:hypothetical protein [bacterium]
AGQTAAKPLVLSVASRDLIQLLEESLRQPLNASEDLARLEVEAIEKAFVEMPRATDLSEIRELKYALLHWRKKTVGKLLAFAQKGSDSEAGLALSVLNRMAVELDPHHYRAFQARVQAMVAGAARSHAERELSKQILATDSTGDSYRMVVMRPAGKEDVGAAAVHGHKDDSAVSKWAGQEKARRQTHGILRPEPTAGEGAYRFRDRMTLLPGDMILLEQSTDTCRDMNTSIADPISLFSHSAIFLEIDHEGEKYPAVLEIYSHGLRILPADLYLSRRFSQYTEIHRFKDRDAQWPARLRQLAARYETELDKWSYDFYAKEFTRDQAARERTANCSNLPSHVRIELGCNPISSRCEVVSGAQKLTGSIGLPFKTYLTPTDYRRDKDLEMVGVIDTLDLESLLAHELVTRNPSLRHTAGGILSQRAWDESKMPGQYSMTANLMGQIQQGSSWGLAGANLTTEWPWTLQNFPKAPPKVIALITTIEPVVGKAMEGLRNELVQYPYEPQLRATVPPANPSSEAAKIRQVLDQGQGGSRVLSLHALEHSPEVKATVEARLAPFNSWFKP